MAATPDCPVDFVQVNENRVRMTALWVLLLVIFSLFIKEAAVPIFAFLTIDFFLRAFNFGKFSPLNTLSGTVVKQLNISNKPIDQAPKRFAAGIGFVLSAVVLALLVINLPAIVLALKIIFATFAFLESFLGICAGCHVYSIFYYDLN